MNEDWVKWLLGISLTVLCAVFGLIWNELKTLRANVHRIAGEVQKVATEVDILVKGRIR